MSDDKIAEIRARHEAGPLGQMPAEDRMSSHLRWRWLLGEVDRRGAEIEKLRAEIERLHKEADLTREALGGWALVPPDGGADPTHERVAAVVAEVARMKKLHAPPADLPWPSREEDKP